MAARACASSAVGQRHTREKAESIISSGKKKFQAFRGTASYIHGAGLAWLLLKKVYNHSRWDAAWWKVNRPFACLFCVRVQNVHCCCAGCLLLPLLCRPLETLTECAVRRNVNGCCGTTACRGPSRYVGVGVAEFENSVVEGKCWWQASVRRKSERSPSIKRQS